jgi:outer membrane lipase/esterase
MRKIPQLALMTALLAFITILSAPGMAGAAGFDQFFAFGDSTLDTGYFRYHLSGNSAFDSEMPLAVQQGATGGFAGNGTMNTVILADKFGLTIAPVDDPSGGGTNYANGGATTVQNDKPDYPNNIFTIQEIETYLNSVHGVANPKALYLIKTGDNDVTYVSNQTQAWRDAHPYYLSEGAAALAVEVARLQAAGARTIVVRNSYDSAVCAAQGGDIDPNNDAFYERSYTLGIWEWAYLHAKGVHFIPADNDSLFRFVAHNPLLFGFDAHSVLSPSAPYYRQQSAALCILTPDQQQHFLFIDGVHLTTAGQTIEADYTYSLLAAPSAISLLGESAVQSGWAHAATIQGQLDPCGQHCQPCARNVWTSVGTYSLNVKNAQGLPGDSGTPFGGTVGIDYQTQDGLIFGAAFTTGSQMPEFSTGGHFSQVDEAPSLYVGYLAGPLWGNAVATYDVFQYNIERLVQLGIFTDQNNAGTNGHSLELALRGGWNLSMGQFICGPVAGLILQQAHINGFTETGLSGVTALSFDDQTRDSLVTQLGWRVMMDGGRLRPFVEANWNHECAGKDRTITTSLTSVGAPSYIMDSVPVASDWATTSLGTFYELNSRTMLRGAASAMYINPQMITCGGEFSLNFCF